MKRNNHSKETVKRIREREDKRFRKILVVFLAGAAFLLLTVNIYFYWPEVRFICQENFVFGPEVQQNIVCMAGDNMKVHETTKVMVNGKIFYTCSAHCADILKRKFHEIGFSKDTVTGKTICKSDALIGLENRHRTHVLYFESKESFKKYYQNLKRTK